jgi:hypothetical protein
MTEVYGPCVQARRQDAELPPVAGSRQGNVANVKFEVEMPIVYPVWIVEIQRYVDQALAKYSRRADPLPYVLEYRAEVDLAVRRRRRVVEINRRYVLMPPGLVGVEKEGIGST